MKLTECLDSSHSCLHDGWISFLSTLNDLVMSCSSSAAMSPAVDIVAKVARVYSRHILQLPREIHAPISAENNRGKGHLDDEDTWGFHVDLDTDVKRLPLTESHLDFIDESCENATVSLDLLQQWEQETDTSSCGMGRDDLRPEPPLAAKMVLKCIVDIEVQM